METYTVRENPHNHHQAMPSGIPTADLEIYTRPEIRKGCLWDIQLRFNPDFVQKHQLSHIFVEKPRSATENTTFLCLKVRSKLIKPIRELPFTKVAHTVPTDGDVLFINDFSTATLKVKFTARPRAVFHKHSDMMILLVSIKKGDKILATSEAELIFRGGTGSAHSAETRKSFTPQPPQHQHLAQGAILTTFSYTTPLTKRPPSPPAAPHVPRPMLQHQLPQTPTSPTSTMPKSSSATPSPTPVIELEDYDSHQFCNDFLQNKGDTLLNNTFGTTPGTFDEILRDSDVHEFGNNVWADNIFSDFDTFSEKSQQQHQPQSQLQTQQQAPNPLSGGSSEFSVVYGKRRGACLKCTSECSHYRGTGGPCSECGCFPAMHVNIDEKNKYRKRKRMDYDDGTERSDKKPRYLLETKFYQKLFFNCLQYMSLQQISKVTAHAPVPLFVKVLFFFFKGTHFIFRTPNLTTSTSTLPSSLSSWTSARRLKC